MRSFFEIDAGLFVSMVTDMESGKGNKQEIEFV